MDNPIQSNTPGIAAGNMPNSAFALDTIKAKQKQDH